MWVSYMCLTELAILIVRSRSLPTWIQNSRKQLYLGKTVNELELLLSYPNPADDEQWWWTMFALTRLFSLSFTESLLSTNCHRAKKQRLLQSSMFVSTITSWDYGYQFFLLYLQVVVSKFIPSIFCEGKTPKIREMVSFELGCSTTEPQRLRWARNPKVWGSIPHGDSEVFLFPTLVTKRKTSFSISLPSSKLTISLILITNMTPSTLLILAVCRTRVMWNL